AGHGKTSQCNHGCNYQSSHYLTRFIRPYRRHQNIGGGCPIFHLGRIRKSKGPEMNRKAFYDALRPTLGALTQANVVGFERYLDEALRRSTALHDLAYILATGWWETGKTMQPVREAYWLDEDWRRRNLRYYPFYGRGDVQLTWEE